MNKTLTNQEIKKYGLTIAADGSIILPVTIEIIYSRGIAPTQNVIGQIEMQLNNLIKSAIIAEKSSVIKTIDGVDYIVDFNAEQFSAFYIMPEEMDIDIGDNGEYLDPYLYDVDEKDPYEFEESECISKKDIVVIQNATYPTALPLAA